MKGKIMKSLVGTKVKVSYAPSRIGEVIKYEPLSPAMTDCLLRFQDGKECWYASSDLLDLENNRLPSRQAIIALAEKESLEQLKQIKKGLIQEWNRPWHGMEFCKALFGKNLNSAIKEIESK